MAKAGVDLMRVRLVISGTVQGVFFRDSTRDEAERLGVAGWVVNLPDGRRVEALLDGPVPAVRELVQWCHHGPDKADVTKVEEFDGTSTPLSSLAPRVPPGQPFAGFKVLR